MKVTIELPEPGVENIEETLAEQYTHLVTVARAMLTDYKKKLGIQVPRISITLPSKLKKVKELTPAQVFTKTLLKHHMDRVPTAHSGKQAGAIARLYESGYTDAEQMLRMYDESADEWAATSWFTVLFHINKQENPAGKANDMEFKRKEFTEDEVESLKNRLANTKEL